MAKGKKTGGKDFKPGVSGNLNGRPPLPKDIKMARELTKEEFTRVANEYLSMTKDQIKEAASNPSTPALNLMIAGLISKAVVEGDQHRLNFLLDRLVGKVPIAVNATVNPEYIEAMKLSEGKTPEELLAILSKRKLP